MERQVIRLDIPIAAERIRNLRIGDPIELYGRIICGRDAVLPKLVQCLREKDPLIEKIALEGAVIFHTAVSPAGIGPTTSNKPEIEESIPALSAAGVRVHVGKGAVSQKTIEALDAHGSVFAVTPPLTALFAHRTISKRVVAFQSEGMEALFEIEVSGFPAIVAVAGGKNIFNRSTEACE